MREFKIQQLVNLLDEGNMELRQLVTSPVKRRSRNAGAILFILCWCLLPSMQGQDTSAAAFKFTRVDNQLLDEANELDHLYAKQGLVLDDPELQAYVESIGRGVIGTRPAPERVEFRFRVLRDPMVNAFASPNGSVYVTTGLLALLENEAQLAGVLGHEVTHVYNRHSYLENRSQRKKVLAINLLQGAASGVPGVAYALSAQLGAQVSSVILIGSVYGYSQEMERQADTGGLSSLVSTSYDPRAMASAFALLDKDQKLEYEPVRSFYHDHPKLTDRFAWAVDAARSHPVAEPRTGTESEYLAKVAPAICSNIEADLNSRRARTAVNRATRLTTAFPDEPKYQVLLADSYRALGAKTQSPSAAEQTRQGQSEHRDEYFKMTEQEEQKYLLGQPEGVAANRENLDQAEKLYQGVIERSPSLAEAYRGLGFLYEQQNKYAEAAMEYRRYLELVAGTSLDHLRIERRLAAVEKLETARPPQSR